MNYERKEGKERGGGGGDGDEDEVVVLSLSFGSGGWVISMRFAHQHYHPGTEHTSGIPLAERVVVQTRSTCQPQRGSSLHTDFGAMPITIQHKAWHGLGSNVCVYLSTLDPRFQLEKSPHQ
jgi:hypothetical protein